MKISMGSELKHIIMSLNEMLDGNIVLECKKSGLYCKMADDATVCLLEVFISKDLMSEYTVSQGEIVGVDINLLNKIMKTIKFDKIDLETINNTTLKIVSEGQRKCEFELPLVDVVNEEMDIPDIDYDCNFTMETNAFQGVCKDLKQFGEEVVLKVSDKVLFTTKDEIECKIEVNAEIENEDNIVIEKKYDLKYFLKMLKGLTLTNEVFFYVSKNMPLVIEYKMDESYIRYYLGNMV